MLISKTANHCSSCIILPRIDGHFVGEKGVQATASALNAAYNGGKELVGFGEPNVSLEATEDGWTPADVKNSGILAKLR